MSSLNTSGSSEEDESLFEGCGREGPVLAICLSEFHPTVGPKIVYQYPPDIVEKELFDALSSYIIPKTHLQRITMTVNILGKKIIGYPIQIQDEKYERNAFYFNTCLVCDSWARTVQYEGILVKLAEFFHSLEVETECMSKNIVCGTIEAENDLKELFSSILLGINGPLRECSVVFQDRPLALKVVPAVLRDPSVVESHAVPVIISDVGPVEKWDLTTKQIIPFVNGFNHVAMISHMAGVNQSLVKTCLRNLLYYDLIKMIPAFQYSNMYCVSPLFHSKLMLADTQFKTECLTFVARSEHFRPSFADVVRFYCGLKRGVTLKELCGRLRTVRASIDVPTVTLDSSRYSDLFSQSISSSRASSTNPTGADSLTQSPVKIVVHRPSPSQFNRSLSSPSKILTSPTKSDQERDPESEPKSILTVIDERKLILFGLVHKLIRRVEKYPVLLRKKMEDKQEETEKNGVNGIIEIRENLDDYDQSQSRAPSRNENQDKPKPLNSSKGATATPTLQAKLQSIYAMFNGTNTVDHICLAHGLSQNELDEMIEQDEDVVTIFK